MNNLKVFNHNQFGKLDTIIGENNTVYFNGNQVASMLGYSNTRDALKRHCKGVVKHDTLKNKGGYPLTIIPEPDLYRLIIGSQLPSAEQFEKWVFEEVLPSIRKSGGYIQNQENLTPEQILANAVLVAENVIKEKELQLEKERLLREEAQQTVQLQAPKVLAYDSLMDIGKDLDFSATAKAFNIPGLGRNNLMKLLRDKKVLMKNNNPYQNFIDAGYFRIIVIPNEFSPTKTLITNKGLKWLAGKLVSWGYLANSQNVN